MVDKEQQISESGAMYGQLQDQLELMLDTIARETNDIKQLESKLNEGRWTLGNTLRWHVLLVGCNTHFLCPCHDMATGMKRCSCPSVHPYVHSSVQNSYDCNSSTPLAGIWWIIIRMVGLMLSYAQRQEFAVTCSIKNLRPWFQGAQWGVVFIHIMTLLGRHLLAKIGWQENVSNVSQRHKAALYMRLTLPWNSQNCCPLSAQYTV